ncbi:MAG: hypothetical protein Q4B52_08185 [Tissierellia bacterium]|nr:hypothetical protein [Tissierellia bacterium]
MLDYWLDSIDKNGCYKYLYKVVGIDDEIGFLIIDPNTYKVVDYTDLSEGYVAECGVHALRSILANKLPKKGSEQWY